MLMVQVIILIFTLQFQVLGLLVKHSVSNCSNGSLSLRFRGSWAQVGNDTDPYYVNQAYGFGTIELPNGGNIYTNTLNTIMKASNLKPERKNAWEIGLDFRTFKNRLNLDVTYYKENTKDQIMEIATPWVSGISTQLINAGNIQNQGIELALNTIPFQNEDWEWGLDFTWTKNTSKIVELHPDAAEYISLAGQVNAYVTVLVLLLKLVEVMVC